MSIQAFTQGNLPSGNVSKQLGDDNSTTQDAKFMQMLNDGMSNQPATGKDPAALMDPMSADNQNVADLDRGQLPSEIGDAGRMEKDEQGLSGQDPNQDINALKQLAENNGMTLEELLSYKNADKEELEKLAERLGIPLEELLKMLGLATEDEAGADGGAGAGAGSGAGAGGGAGAEGGAGGAEGGSGKGGAGGAEGAGSGSGSEGVGGNSPEPVGQVQAESLDGKVKFYADNKADAEKLKENFDKLYEGDKDFKAAVDKVIAENGSMNVSAKDLDGIAGVANINGNNLAIDTNSLSSQEVLAHEVLHNVGYEHGASMDAAVNKAIDLA